MQKVLTFLIKATITATLLCILFQKVDLGVVLKQIYSLPTWSLASAFACSLTAILCASRRWSLFIKPSSPGPSRVLSLYLIGMFFNTVLPGLLGGDVVKGYYLYRRHVSATAVASSIFMDRYLGYVVLLALGALAYPFAIATLRGTGLGWLFPGILVCFALVSYLLLFRQGRGKLKFLAGYLGDLEHHFKDTATLIKGLLLSLLVQFFSFLSVFVLSKGFGFEIPPILFLAFLPLIITLSNIPITISGSGIREASFVLLFGAHGLKSESALALSLAWFAVIFMTGLLGLPAYLRSGK